MTRLEASESIRSPAKVTSLKRATGCHCGFPSPTVTVADLKSSLVAIVLDC